MKRTNTLGPFSWHVAIPTKPGGFTPLDREFAFCDRVTDIGQIPAFSVATPEDNCQLAWSDFQLPPRYPSPRCPGSGRAAVYEGWYLKGIGRTQFCWNWHIEAGTMHGTGHMFPSAAIRELLATAYVRARGLGHTIVPCESLLLRPLAPDFRARLERFAANNRITLSPIDRELQAITVKPADFIRWSNLLAAASFASSEVDAVLEIAGALLRGADPTTTPDSGTATVETVLEAVRDAVARGFRNFIEFYRVGLYWNSYNNNFTLDGRFLDLELPTVLAEGRPCALVYRRRHEPDPVSVDGRATICGEGPLHFVAQTRAALEQLADHLLALAARAPDPEVEEYATELAVGLREIARERSAIADNQAIIDRLSGEWLRGGADVERITQALRDSVAEILTGGPSCHYPDPETPSRWIDVAAPEPGLECRAFYPTPCGEPPTSEPSLRMIQVFNDSLREADELVDVAQALDFFGAARATILALSSAT